MAADASLFEYLLRLGDNCLVLGHRLSELCGLGPAIEEDLAIANVGLDLIGQTQFWLGYAAEVEANGRNADTLAYLRDSGDFHNLLLVEQPNGDFAVTMARQFLFDTWHYLLLVQLGRSTDPRIAAIAEKAVKEVSYHLERSQQWILRLGDGTDESHRRMQTAIDDLWMYTGELFEADAIDRAIADRGVGPDPASLQEPWKRHVHATLEEATLKPPKSVWMQRGGKRGTHSEHLGYILAEMQFLQRAYPGATW
jgi:ring-1,2-phenylacetyl-CoA epoxidase subunit PaaC